MNNRQSEFMKELKELMLKYKIQSVSAIDHCVDFYDEAEPRLEVNFDNTLYNGMEYSDSLIMKEIEL